jgi:hypothetical protein
MKRKIVLIALASMVAAITGCASIQPVSPEVNRKVIATVNPPPKNCKYMGQALGNQGNFFTGAWTSNANLEQGAMTDLKNKAYSMGGNYVQIVTNRAGVTGSSSFSGDSSGFFGGGSSEQTNVTSTGNVYKCPAKAIGLG